MADEKKTYEDPSPSEFRKQFVIVAIVLIVIGIAVFFLVSAAVGGVIALIGSIFGIGSRYVSTEK